jgi:hypothetical protein
MVSIAPERKGKKMSACLGPIHHWLYHKVQLQEALIQTILDTARRNHWTAVSAETVNAVCGEMDLRPLEEIIDPQNIHGWLQQKIGVVEIRLAFLVTELLKEGTTQRSDLEQVSYGFGQQHPVDHASDASSVFKALGDGLLDGMPCDFVNVIREQGEGRLVWQQTKCVHQTYWEQVNGDINVYHALRTQMIKGMLSGSGFTLNAGEDGLFEIRKE